jgi:hypothetical protein
VERPLNVHQIEPGREAGDGAKGMLEWRHEDVGTRRDGRETHMRTS